jgi:hypothetical protein
MKKILFFLFLVSALISKAQFPNTITSGNSSTLQKANGAYGGMLGYVFAGSYGDTTAANLSFIKNVPGIVIRNADTIWLRNSTATEWLRVNVLSNSGSSLKVDSVTTNSDSTILQYWVDGAAYEFYDFTKGLTGSDTTIFETVIDTTGQPGQRVLYASGNKIRSTPYFIFDSANRKLVIGNQNISVGGPNTKLWVTGNANITGNLTANSFIKQGGTSSQFLKADGSVDGNTYLTTETDPTVATAIKNIPVSADATTNNYYYWNNGSIARKQIATSELNNDAGFITSAGVNNIYNANGTLTGNRTVTLDDKYFSISRSSFGTTTSFLLWPDRNYSEYSDAGGTSFWKQFSNRMTWELDAPSSTGGGGSIIDFNHASNKKPYSLYRTESATFRQDIYLDSSGIYLKPFQGAFKIDSLNVGPGTYSLRWSPNGVVTVADTALTASDIPNISQSQVTGLPDSLGKKVDSSSVIKINMDGDAPGKAVLSNGDGVNFYLGTVATGTTTTVSSGFKRLDFRVGVNSNAPVAGDSTITHDSLIGKFVKVYRYGELQHFGTTFGIEVDTSTGTITVHPALEAREIVIVEAYDYSSVTELSFPAVVPGWVDLLFPSINQNVTITDGTPDNTIEPTTNTNWNQKGCEDLLLASGDDGAVIQQYKSGGQFAVIGFQSSHAMPGSVDGSTYTTCLVGAYLHASGAMYKVENGAEASLGVSLTLNDWVGVFRESGVWYLRKSSDKTTWTDLATLSPTPAGDLYPAFWVYGTSLSGKMYNPQGQGLQ